MADLVRVDCERRGHTRGDQKKRRLQPHYYELCRGGVIEGRFRCEVEGECCGSGGRLGNSGGAGASQL